MKHLRWCGALIQLRIAIRHWGSDCYFFARFVVQLVVLFLTVTLDARAAERCTPSIARLVSLQGNITVLTHGASTWQAAMSGMVLCPRDQVRVEAGSRAALLLSNETTVRLNQKTTVTFNGLSKNSPQSRSFLDLLNGAIHVITRTPTPFQIHTPFVNANIEGTEFVVAVSASTTTLGVIEGRIAAENSQGRIVLTQGETGIAANGQAPVKSLRIHPSDAVQWALYYPTIFEGHPYLKTGSPAAVEPTAPSLSSLDKTRSDESQQAVSHLYRQGKIVEALAELNAIAIPAGTTRSADWLTFHAGLLLAVGRFDEANQEINLALEQDSTNQQAYALKTVIAVTQNDKAAATAYADKATSTSPHAAISASAWLARSYAEQANFRITEALASAHKATTVEPHNGLAWARQAELEMSAGNQKKALAAASQAKQIRPDLSKIQTVLGFSYLTGMQTASAKIAFENAILLDQSDPLPRLGLGLAKIRDGDLVAGRTDLAIAASLDPADPLIRSYLGKAYFEEKRDALAATQFGLAKTLDPFDPTPWFYDALRKQSEDRPVEALADLQQSIALNQQRAVYRSQFLLDSDRASRQTSVAKIYDDLALYRFAVTEATQSLTSDPANYSGHRFLSDAYARLDRHEIASVSELLQAQLLQPLNLNPLQPELAFSNVTTPGISGPVSPSLNEFNSLFERNGLKFIASGLAGNHGTNSAETIVTGLQDQLSYSVGGFHYRSDGYRFNNDIHHNIGSAFVQYAITPQFNVQAEVRHRKTEHGDISLTTLPGTYSNTYRRALDQTTGRLGAHWSGSATADTLFSLIHSTADERQRFDGEGLATLRSHDQGVQLEAQQLLRFDHFNLVTGAGYYEFDVRENIFGAENQFKRSRKNAYGYAHVSAFDTLIWTIGASVDRYAEANFSQQKINPKIGVQWQPTPRLKIRAASFQTIKPALYVQQTIEPTEVAGFNQFFDEGNGTRARRDSVALDVKAASSIDLQLEASRRRLSLPILADNAQVSSEAQQEKTLRLSAGWRSSPRWSIDGEARFEGFQRQAEFLSGPTRLRTHTAMLGVRHFDPNGVFARLSSIAVRQKVNSINGVLQQTSTNHFALLDAALGMRLPRRMGSVTIEAKNLLDKKFRYQDANFRTPAQQTPPFIPARSVVVQLTAAF